MRHRAWIEVDLDTIVHNAMQLHERSGLPLLAMIKADGYGHGAVAVCTALQRWSASNAATGNTTLHGVGVATLEEARVLRDECGLSLRILCTTPLLADELQLARELAVVPSLSRADEIERWNGAGGGEWHLSIDTGMLRAGVRWDEVAQLRTVTAQFPPHGVWSHFHSADAHDGSMAEQERRLQEACDLLDIASSETHLDNSAAIAARSQPHATRKFVRPGMALYGGLFHDPLGVRGAASIRARIVDIHVARPGDSVSYGATWRAGETRTIATLAIGHADGYRQQLGNRASVLVNGARVPVVGMVTMDMTMIDITGVPCEPGDIATLLGTDGDQHITAEELASLAGITVYEFFMGLRLRLPRHYQSTISMPGADT